MKFAVIGTTIAAAAAQCHHLVAFIAATTQPPTAPASPAPSLCLACPRAETCTMCLGDCVNETAKFESSIACLANDGDRDLRQDELAHGRDGPQRNSLVW